jgi:hypothetical protein
MRLDGDEMATDADDGDAGHATAAYIATEPERGEANGPVSQQGVGLRGVGGSVPIARR